MKTLLTLALLLSLAGSAPAAADELDDSISGQSCVARTPQGRDAQLFSVDGAFNDSASWPHNVWYCPARWTSAILQRGSISATVLYLDRSDVDGVECSVHVVSSAGTTYFTPTTFSCPTSGGCSSPDPSFQAPEMRNLTLHLTANPGETVIPVGWVVRCEIPVPTSLGKSGLIGIRFHAIGTPI